MSGDPAATGRLTDARARQDVEHNLEATLFVEAGAGSGKTTALVARIVRLICSGRCELRELAAVTFTEAAAAELSVRVRDRLAQIAGGGRGEPDAVGGVLPVPEDERRRAGEALDRIDEAAISTIHGFCQRLLAEHPIEVGLPPRFEVLDAVQQSLEWQRQWSDALDGFGADAGARALFQVAALLSITRIEELVRDVAEEWDRCGSDPPDGLAVLAGVKAIVADSTAAVIVALDAALELAGECRDPSDLLALKLERLRPQRDFLAGTTRWEDQLAALAAQGNFGGNYGKKEAWICDVNLVKRALDEADGARDQAVKGCCDLVLPALVAMADVLARSLATERRASGRLTFHDLLVLARDLLAHQPDVLASVRRRLRYLLVDEFQDTDPLQLEIAELLAFGGPDAGALLAAAPAGGPGAAAPDAAAPDARAPDVGRLFFVGDPQQSIYRFRGADLDAYVAARERHAVGGATMLTSNFRSVPGILGFVNECFSSMIGETFSRLDAVRPDAGSGPPVRIVGGPFTNPKLRRFAQRELESEACAKAIDRAVRSEKWMVEDQSGSAGFFPDGLRPARFSDVAILVPRRTGLDQIEVALDAHGIGYRVESASLIFRSQEVRNLLALCRSIDAPGDELALVAALRSPAFGCGDDDLRAYRALGGRWSTESRPPAELSSGAVSTPASPPAPTALTSERVAATSALRASPSLHDREGGDPAIVVDALERLATFRSRRHELGAIGVLELAVRDRRLLQLAATTPRARESWRRVRFLLEQARAFVTAGGGGLSEFADWVDEQLSEGLRAVESVLPEPDEDVVHILTVHGAKGLEFPITVLAGFGTTDAVSAPAGPRVLRDAGGVEVRFRRKLETSGYERLFAAERQRDREEAGRVLYVAATRARDHLIFCGHHMPVTTSAQSLGQSLYETAVAVSNDNPSLCELLDLGAPEDDGSLVQGSLFSLDVVSGAEDAALGYLSWKDTRAELLERISRRSSVRATEVAGLAGFALGVPAEAGPSSDEGTGSDDDVGSDDEADIALVGGSGRRRSSGRAGTRIGRAVHATLQSIGRGMAQAIAAAPSVQSPELRRIATAQARAERVAERAGEVEQLARVALSSPTVRAAFASRTLRRELYVSTKVDGVVLDGYVDLCFEDDDGLVVIDYKTDSVGDASEVELVSARYELQAAAYALALGAAAGKPVTRCVLVFLRPTGQAIEHDVTELAARVDAVRAVVGATAGGAGAGVATGDTGD